MWNAAKDLLMATGLMNEVVPRNACGHLLAHRQASRGYGAFG